MNTRSAHCRSLSVSPRTFRSTSRFSHCGGSMAATVSSPSGGNDAFLRTNFSACLKLQNVSGKLRIKQQYLHGTNHLYARSRTIWGEVATRGSAV